MAVFRSAVSSFMFLIRHQGEHSGATWITLGFCSRLVCTARFRPALVLRSKLLRRSIGDPTCSPWGAALWHTQAEPAKIYRKSLFLSRSTAIVRVHRMPNIFNKVFSNPVLGRLVWKLKELVDLAPLWQALQDHSKGLEHQKSIHVPPE